MKSISLIALSFCMASSLFAQEFPFNKEQWQINANGYVLEPFEGKQSLYLYQGRAILKDVEFFTGILEYDIYVTERRGFPGLQFRTQDAGNAEEFYIRPHQTGNPDANQYTPVYNGLSGWQLYHGQGYAGVIDYKMNAWNHIKLVVAETSAEVYINDMETPLFYIPQLKHDPKPGGLRFQGGGPSPFHFADLKVTKQTNPVLKSEPFRFKPLTDNVIKTWAVSNAFAESSLEKSYELTRTQKAGLKWQNVAVEEKGQANLGQVTGTSQQANTVFAKVIIESDKKQVKQLVYGYSDRARVFLNDQILAGGQNQFRSRDYRYLGTIGYFDAVYLNLKKGTNELWIAVSEDFGGWGIMAQFEDMEGIQLK